MVMDWMRRLIGKRATKNSHGHPSSPQEAWVNGWVWAPPTASGEPVTESTALTYSAVWDAIRLISEGIASLPLHKFREDSEGRKTQDRTSTMAWWFRDQPNPAMTPMVFIEVVMRSAVSWGNGFAEIERDGRGNPLWIWPLRPDYVTIEVTEGGLPTYLYREPGRAPAMIDRTDMIHVPGPSFDGIRGYSPITLARESIGSALAAEKYGAAFYGNSARPSGILKHKGVMTPEKHKQTMEAWERTYGGASKAGKVAVLGIDTEWQPLGLPQDDAQFIESRQFSVVEVARWFNIPPHKLKDLSRATFSNIEQQGIDWVTGTLRPWMVRFEQELDRKTIMRGGGYWRFSPDALLRGDTESRYKAHAVGITNGILTIDEARALEDREPHPDGIGSRPLFPANTMFLDEGRGEPAPEPEPDPPMDPEPIEPEPTPDDEPAPEPDEAMDRSAVVAEYAGLFQDALARSVNKEHKATATARKKHGGDLIGWAERFHLGEQADILTAWMVPIISAMARRIGRPDCPEATVAGVAGELARMHGRGAIVALQAGIEDYLQPGAGEHAARAALLGLEDTDGR